MYEIDVEYSEHCMKDCVPSVKDQRCGHLRGIVQYI